MFNTFNNQSIRKLVVAVGSLFDQIYVTRKNDTTGAEENIKVPITFASKEKFLRRLESNSSISDKVKTQINLPYLSFEMSSVAYDRNRKRNKLRVATGTDDSGLSYKSFSETPVDIEFRVYFYSRSMEELLQITEQILPYFNPEFNVRINFNDLFKDINVPINYRDFRILDDYEGALSNSRRMMIGTMVFVANSYIYGEIKSENPPISASMRIADLLTEDYVPPVTSLIINSELPAQQYDHPSDTVFLFRGLSWTEENVSNPTTTILVLNSSKEIIYSGSTEAGRQSLTTAMYDSLLEAIAEDLNACGGLSNGQFTYTLLVKNNQVGDSSTFTFSSFDSSGICNPIRSLYVGEGLALTDYALPEHNGLFMLMSAWKETNVLGETTTVEILDSEGNSIYSKDVTAGVETLVISDVEDIAAAIANDLSTCGEVYSDPSTWTFRLENGELSDSVTFTVTYVNGDAICPATLTVNPELAAYYKIPGANSLLNSRMTWYAQSYINPNTTIEILDSDSNVIYTTTVANDITSVSSDQYTAIVSAIVTDLNACGVRVSGTFVYTLRITNDVNVGSGSFTITEVTNQLCSE